MTRVQLAELDLKQQSTPASLDPNTQRLDLLVRWGYQPLGVLELPDKDDEDLPLPGDLYSKAVELLGWELWADDISGNLDGVNRLADSDLPPISVIVCTRDRATPLQRCLESLQSLAYPRYEVVVIDNGSRDPAVRQVVAQASFRYVREDQPGLDRARNRGVKEAQHGLIAFIDDDAVATPGWLRGLAYAFQTLEVAAVTGLVLPGELATQAQVDFEQYGGMGKGFRRFVIRREGQAVSSLFWASGWGVGTNMAFRRDLLERLGGFDVALDVGTPTHGGGDIEFFYRLVSCGYVLAYEPAALVRHFHRRDPASLRRQIYNNGRAFPAFLLTIARNQPGLRAQVFWFGLREWAWGWLLKRLLRSFIHFDLRTLGWVVAEMRGALDAPAAYWRSQRYARQASPLESGSENELDGAR